MLADECLTSKRGMKIVAAFVGSDGEGKWCGSLVFDLVIDSSQGQGSICKNK